MGLCCSRAIQEQFGSCWRAADTNEGGGPTRSFAHRDHNDIGKSECCGSELHHRLQELRLGELPKWVCGVYVFGTVVERMSCQFT